MNVLYEELETAGGWKKYISESEIQNQKFIYLNHIVLYKINIST